MAYLKRLIQIGFLIFLIMGIWFYSHRVLSGQDYSLDVEKLIVEGKDSNVIHLSQINPNMWDEMIIWYPFSDIRDFKLDGVCLLFESSNFNSDDGNNVLLFIKDNKINGYAIFSRRKVDFSSFDLGIRRIAKNKAVFKFNSAVEFSKIQFLESK